LASIEPEEEEADHIVDVNEMVGKVEGEEERDTGWKSAHTSARYAKWSLVKLGSL
jgi:hypothetical protein